MRIALVQHAFHLNTAGVINGLEARGHDILSIANIPMGASNGEQAVECDVALVPYGRLSLRRWGEKQSYRLGVPRFMRLFSTLRRFRPDIVIARDVRTVSLITFVIARLIGARPVLWLLKPKLKFGPQSVRWLTGHLLPRRRFHSGYEGEIDRDVRLGPALGSSRLLPLPIPDARFVPTSIPRRDSVKGPVRLIVVSSLSNPKKRPRWALEAIRAMGLESLTTVTFVSPGRVPTEQVRQLRDLEQSLHLAPSEMHFGRSFVQTQALMRDADVFLHPSQKESFGAVIPEAMSQGLAVLASDRCGASVCFEDEKSGLIFRSASFEHFCEQLHRLVHDDALRDRIRSSAHRRAQEHLMPEVWAERFEALDDVSG